MPCQVLVEYRNQTDQAAGCKDPGMSQPEPATLARFQQQWLAQQGATELDAMVMKDGLVRADAVPLVFKALGCESLPRGTQVRVRITGTDALTLEVHASLLARLDAVADVEAEDEGDDAVAAAPLALAIDLDESAEPADNTATPP